MCRIDPVALWLARYGDLAYIAGLTCEEVIADGRGGLLLLLPLGEGCAARERRVLAALARVMLARIFVPALAPSAD